MVISEYFATLGERRLEWYLRGLFKAEGERDETDVDRTISSYAFVDLFAGLRASEGGWDVSVWAKNVFDEEARLNLSPTIPVPDYSKVGQLADQATATLDTGYIPGLITCWLRAHWVRRCCCVFDTQSRLGR